MALVYLVVALGYMLLLGPVALLIARDAKRRSRNGWASGLALIWQPVIVAMIYLIVRDRPRHAPQRL
jgi:uncharacterized membrane protein HdeD (DUF308 family)